MTFLVIFFYFLKFIINVAQSYLRQGGIVVGKSAVRVNDYEDIETAAMHPNCSCREKFSVETGEKAGDGEKDAWKRIEVKELPKKLRDDYFGEDTSGWKFDEKPPVAREIEVAKIAQHYLQAKKMWFVPRVEKPDGVKTPDLLIDDTKAEIKEASSIRAVENQLRKALKSGQISRGDIIIYDLTNPKISDEEYLKAVKFRAERYQMKAVAIRGTEIVQK